MALLTTYVIFLYVSFFLYLIYEPIFFSEMIFSPGVFHKEVDFGFYSLILQQYLYNFGEIVQNYINIIKTFSFEGSQHYAGPVYPFLIWVFQYGPDNIYPFAVFYLLIAIFTVSLWLNFFNKNKLPIAAILLFPFIPYFFYFAIFLGSDLLYACLLALVFILNLRENPDTKRIVALFMLALLLVLTRPSGMLTCVFLIFTALTSWKKNTAVKIFLAGCIFLTVFFAFFYSPYFVRFSAGSKAQMIFGMQADLGLYAPDSFRLQDIFQSLSSIVILYVGKLFYALGMVIPGRCYPCFMPRVFYGGIMLLGLIAVFLKGEKLHKSFVFFHFFPILYGFTQERYSFGIMPILFFYGIKSIGIFTDQRFVPSGQKI